MKRILILPLLLLIVLLLLLPASWLWQSFARGENNDVTVIASIQGVDYAVPSLEKRLAVYEQQGRPQQEAELKQRLVEREVFYREACAAGCSVDRETVEHYIDDARQALPQDPVTYEMFRQELEVLGLSEDEYWETSYHEYEQMMVNGLYYRQLESEYWHGQLPAAPIDFETWYQDTYLPQLLEKYQVVVY